MTEELLSITGLEVRFRHPRDRRRVIHAVDDIDIRVRRGEVVGLVGESGSGKSTIGRCVLGLEQPQSGSIVFDGIELTSHGRLRSRRELASNLQVVFQDPYSSLNPHRTIGQALAEPFLERNPSMRSDADEKARMVLSQVGLPSEALDRYPSQFSGGQRQRIGIARALMLDPSLIICDEAVSALDLSTQAQVLNLLRELSRDRGLAYLFIAHDLDVVRYIADRTVVLYRGRIMEEGPSDAIHDAPLHPYTAALLESAPIVDPAAQRAKREARAGRAASKPSGPATGHAGCPFAARCPVVEEVCAVARPRDSRVGDRTVACHRYDPDSSYPAESGLSPATAGPSRTPASAG
ncbi:ABC transporter ATP-binding protein [Microbacter sp. GSS18]|nr:ABC transporter ATP-binding protein [Microbacter sp. GSS18]